MRDVAAASRCGHSKTSAYVGFKGPLVNTEHQIGGDFEILDDCTFKVSMFSYDGQAPATYWWCGSSTSAFSSGSAANDWLFSGVSNGYRTLILELKEGLTWETCKAVSSWCEDVSADLGHVELLPAAQAPALPNRLPDAMTDTMVNCRELQPGVMNVYWTLDSDDVATAGFVRMTLQGALPPTDWMGLGFNSPDLDSVEMVGSDVVIAGLLPSLEPFVDDFFLGARSPCAYNTPGQPGVCPDSYYTNSSGSNNVKLLGMDRRNGVTSITFLRPLKAVDSEYDHDWPTASARPVTFAHGPLNPTSTAERPVVLYHGPSNHAASDATLNLGDKSYSCPTPIGTASGTEPPLSTQPSPSPSPAVPGGSDSNVLFGRTSITVTQGPNPNYPNPPAWGLSYHLDGLETPVLKLFRDVTYTFNIQAGNTHPLYLTSDINGGRSNSGETVYAGGAASFGTAQNPYALSFTPNASTPSEFFYQCWNHQKLGWRVKVIDSDDGSACSKTHPFVGFSSPLTSLEGTFAATLTVVDDCTFSVTGLKYDGAAPDTFWYGAATADASAFKAGWELAAYTAGAADGSGPAITVRMSNGASWDQIGAVGFYCKSLDVLMGVVTLGAPSTVPSPSPSGTSPSPGPAASPRPVPSGSAPPPPPPPMRWCSTRSSFVGYQISLRGREHGLSGIVTVVDTCTIRISKFTYDGQAPDVYWFGADKDRDSAFASGTILTPYTGGAADGTGPDIIITLPRGVSFSSLRAISFYCKSMALSLASAPLAEKCGSSSPLVGFTAPLMGMEHVAYGTFKILDDCTASVEDFIYDGQAPDAFWKVGPSATNFSYAAGARMLLEHSTGAANRSAVVLRLGKGMTWGKTIRGLSFYCETMAMSMATVAIPAAPCKASHAAVGAFIPLMPVEHVTYGTLEIRDDCTGIIHDLLYDGAAPDIHIRLAPEDSDASFKSAAAVDVLPWLAGQAAAARPMTIVFKLPPGQSWSSLKAVSVWCRSVSANMASAPVLPKCGSSPLSGSRLSLAPVVHVAPGAQVAVLDTCTIQVTGFTYDGAAPDLHWYGAPNDTAAAYNSSAAVLLMAWAAGAVQDAIVYLRLPTGMSLSAMGGLSAWCSAMGMNMGSVALAPGCGRTHALVGASSPLTALEHVSPGAMVTVVDDCTIRVDGFTYDGLAPDAFWVAGANDSTAAYNASAMVLSPMWTGGAATASTVFIRLPPGVTLDDVPALSFFCKTMAVNMASTLLLKGCAPKKGAKPRPEVGRTYYFRAFDHVSPGASLLVLDECTLLVEGFTYDGLAPDAFWVAAHADSTAAYNASTAVTISPWTHGAVSSGSLKLKLPKGVTWRSINGISFFCKSMAVNMASAAIA
ncbi:hypothetical protein HYH03_010595 [Edaphochlamys debaryana]|uniref:Uncharacterized protein n=1 Tax=Edaphochlamys debaryana TaxID=47281 RepID=A0A836BXG7_9CHLO|nr:hypothetical protein HYH03_010595 [Edaphochlamys debaryana]|eukprot:KAG2491154.1 hypothetical protein HYH03_010595 [Edaphochlamys debaryana]